MHEKLLTLIALAFVALPTSGFAFAGDHEHATEETPAEEGTSADAEQGEEVLITLSAPLTSPLFAETPVAVVDEEPITFYDLKRRIGSIHREVDKGSKAPKKDYADLLDRVITTKLIVHEARNIGLDELPEFVKTIETMSTDLLMSRLMSQHLDGVEPDPDDVSELYEKMSREFLISTVKLQREADALSFKEKVESGEDFEVVAKQFEEDRKAEFDGGDGQYVMLKDLLPRIAQTVLEMEAGSVSEIFADSGVFTLFRVEAARSYDDPALMEEVRQKVLEPAKQKAALEYADYLAEKHSTVDERLLKKVDFNSKKTGFLSFGKEEPADLTELAKDERVVATIHADPPYTVTIGDLASEVRDAFFHGIETAIERKQDFNEEKRVVLSNLLFKRTAVAEARSLGLDQTDSYLDTMDEFATSRLFEVFVNKVIAPDVEISEDEVREYYESHPEEFSNPTMFRLNAIAFTERRDAERALDKLNRRADYKWVSANSPGRTNELAPGVFDFDGSLLSVTAMPEDLHHRIEDAKQGDALIYSDGQGFHHVLVVDKVFPSKPRPYGAARSPAAKAIFERKVKQLIEDWSDKLKEAYETRIFVEGLSD